MKNDEKSIKARMEYLNDVFKLKFLIKNDNEKEFITLESIPFGFIDVFFIIGHDLMVYSYLNRNLDKIKEKTIIAITCNPFKLKKFVCDDKKIFVAKNNDGITDFYDGKEWGFNFDITDSELDLYNCKEDSIDCKIRKAMIDINNIEERGIV